MENDIEVEYEKIIYNSIAEIKSFQSEKVFKIINEFKNIEVFCTVEKNNNEDFFKCKIFLDNPIIGLQELKEKLFDHNQSLILYKLAQIFTIDYDSIVITKTSFNVPQIFTIILKKFHSGSIEDFDNKFHRLLIPIEKEVDFDLFSTKLLKVDSVISSNLIEVKIDENKYHIYQHSDSDKNEYFFIIEGQDMQSFANFKKSCESIIIAYAFSAGPIVQHQNFYQSFNDLEFKSIENIFFERKSSNLLIRRPVINPSEFKKYVKESDFNNIEQYKKFSDPFSHNIFSNLCNSIKNNTVFSRCCQLIIEANNTKQNLLKAGILSITLETITTLVYDENKERVKLISDKQIAEKLKQNLLNELNKFKEDISEEAIKILTSKINQINTPTNSKKLAFPFEYYGITLSDVEKQILNHRNKFLHGTSPFEESQLEQKETELIIIVSHLLFMVNTLILKYINYTGHIVHYPSIVEYKFNLPLSDKLYRII